MVLLQLILFMNKFYQIQFIPYKPKVNTVLTFGLYGATKKRAIINSLDKLFNFFNHPF